jgi:hypothetical protein
MASLNCVHCGNALTKIVTDLLSDWGGAPLFVCFNPDCEYYENSWSVMARQGSPFGYRYYYSEETDNDGAFLVASPESYLDCIVAEEDYVTMERKEENQDTEYDNLCQAIKHAEQVAKGHCDEACAADHRQLARWLRQLKTIKFPHRAGTKKP